MAKVGQCLGQGGAAEEAAHTPSASQSPRTQTPPSLPKIFPQEYL